VASKKEALAHAGLLILRASFGVHLALLHGADKLQLLTNRAVTFPDPLRIGSRNQLIATVIAELVCAAFVALGFATRLSALVVSAVLGVAAFTTAAGVPWARRELLLLQLSIAAALVLLGPGKLSIDGLVLPRFAKRGGAPRPAPARG
jgi:putative oxidoreductase